MSYQEWVTYHCQFFAFTGESDIKAMLAWRNVIDAKNRGEFDLCELTKKLGAGQYSSFIRDHLQALLSLMRNQRAARYRDERSDGSTRPDYGTCTLCQSTGRVTVPHPRSVVDGRWQPMALTSNGSSTYYTAAVLCNCQLGCWFRDRQGDKRDGSPRGQMTILDYVQMNPDWQEQMRHRRAIEQEVARLSCSEGGDLASAIDRVAARYRLLV